MNDKISIIMSTYKTPEKYLRQSVESVLTQTYKNFEFIIICDGDKNDYEIVKSYDDDRIRIIEHTENMGLPHSLNEAITKASGKYIARMDSDDICIENRLEKQLDFMNKHPNIKITGMFCKCFGAHESKNALFFNDSKEIKIQLLYRSCFAHPTVMIEKEYLIKNNLKYNTEYRCSQDFELWSKIVTNDNAYIIPTIGLKYRIHDKQATISKRKLQVELTKNIIDNNIKEAKLNSVDNINELMYVLGELDELNTNNYLNLSKTIDVVVKKNEVFNKKTLKKVLYNRYFQILLKCKEIKISHILLHFSVLKKVVRIYNIRNIIFLIKYKFILKGV